VLIGVEKGTYVHAGDVLARLSAGGADGTGGPGACRAPPSATRDPATNVYAGVRREQVDSLKAAIAKA